MMAAMDISIDDKINASLGDLIKQNTVAKKIKKKEGGKPPAKRKDSKPKAAAKAAKKRVKKKTKQNTKKTTKNPKNRGSVKKNAKKKKKKTATQVARERRAKRLDRGRNIRSKPERKSGKKKAQTLKKFNLPKGLSMKITVQRSGNGGPLSVSMPKPKPMPKPKARRQKSQSMYNFGRNNDGFSKKVATADRGQTSNQSRKVIGSLEFRWGEGGRGRGRGQGQGRGGGGGRGNERGKASVPPMRYI